MHSTSSRPSRTRAARRVLPLLAASAATLAVPAVADAQRAEPKKVKQPTVDVLLQYRERPGLHAFVEAVTDPRSSRYRQYLTVDQLAARFGAPRKERRAVAAWADSHGLTTAPSPSGTFAVVGGTSDAIADALGTGTRAVASASTARPHLPVPDALDGAVTRASILDGADRPSVVGAPGADAAQSTPALPPQLLTPEQSQEILSRAFGTGRLRTGTPQGCEAGTNAGLPMLIPDTRIGRTLVLENHGFTPNQYTEGYGHARMHRRGLRGEGMRIALLETDGFKHSDIATFARCFGLGVPRISQTPIAMRRMPAAGDETTLDISVLMAAAPRLSNVDIYATPGTPAALLKGAVATLRAGKPKPDAISISLGICEPLLTGNVYQARAMADVFATAAGAGIGVFVSTGDAGDSACSQAIPSAIPAVAVPSTLPYVTAVGGTNVTLDARNQVIAEVPWNNSPGQLAGGTGGSSILFDTPWYQERVSRGNGGRNMMRAVPDVAMLADLMPGYALYCTADVAFCRPSTQPQGGWTSVGGTSAAAPLTAAGAVLMEQEARRRGQAPVGFVNPLLYDLADGKDRSQVLRDVTRGSNDTTSAVPRDAGGGRSMGAYDAARGFDLASGWGSPKVSAFSRAALRAGARAAARADGDDRRAARK